jgi:tetratricopeptide (TPR) repeat protein
MLGFSVLVAVALLTFLSVFLYLYLKPKYGGLVLKTTPPDAVIYLDGEERGASPITFERLRAGRHQVRALKEGYQELARTLQVMPYATENLHWELEPLVAQLTNEQLAEIEALSKKLGSAEKENILLPPPQDYNVLYFADRMLEIDPANARALEAKERLAESLQMSADLAYARENWIEAEKHYRNLALLFPDDISIGERLADLGAKIEQSLRNRDRQIMEWKAKADAALKAGILLPPAEGNALELLRNIQRLDRRNIYLRDAMVQLLEKLQNRGDRKISSGDWQDARREFRLILQYFPDDEYSKSRLELAEIKIAEADRAERLRQDHARQAEQSQRRVEDLRSAALEAYRVGQYDKSINDWHDYLEAEPNSAEAYFYLGAAYIELEQLNTAILNFEHCLAIDPQSVLAHLNLGILYDRHRNDLDRAIVHYKRAAELGGVEKYDPERLKEIVQELEERSQLNRLHTTPFPAEHKHVFSSCRGNLYFTEKGVEYRTTETDHSFYEVYGRLRGFEVRGDDLSIRTGNNKKYNFRLLRAGDGARVDRLVSRYLTLRDEQ